MDICTGYILHIDRVPPANNRTVSERPLWNRGRAFRVVWARVSLAPTSSRNTRQQAQNAVEMTITASRAIFHPDRQMQAKIPPLAKNEVMDTDKELEPKTQNLQGTRLWRVHM